MTLRTIPGIVGKVFIPDEEPSTRKHPCRDCYTCQQCNDDRCRVCRADGPAASSGASGSGEDRRPAGCKDGRCH